MPRINNNLLAYDERVAILSTQSAIANVSKDQKALVKDIAAINISSAINFQNISTIVKKNLKDLQERFSFMSKHLIYELNNQEVGLRIKASEVNSDLPIMGNAYEGSMDLLSPLPFRQQKPGIATIFDLLQQEFPKSTGLIFDKKNISKIVKKRMEKLVVHTLHVILDLWLPTFIEIY